VRWIECGEGLNWGSPLECASSSKGRQENAGVGWREDEWARMGEINPTISQYRDQEGCAGHTYCTFISASNRILTGYSELREGAECITYKSFKTPSQEK
jgi:hypothetical protein